MPQRRGISRPGRTSTMRRASILAVGITGALALTACGGDDEPETAADETETTEQEAEQDEPEPEGADLRLWVNGGETPQEMRDWLVATFEEQHPGSTLTIEEQAW